MGETIEMMIRFVGFSSLRMIILWLLTLIEGFWLMISSAMFLIAKYTQKRLFNILFFFFC